MSQRGVRERERDREESERQRGEWETERSQRKTERRVRMIGRNGGRERKWCTLISWQRICLSESLISFFANHFTTCIELFVITNCCALCGRSRWNFRMNSCLLWKVFIRNPPRHTIDLRIIFSFAQSRWVGVLWGVSFQSGL